jgi:uncharacterized protein
MIESGELANATVNGVQYVWPAGRVVRKESDETVRFLAPFDPLVWDRRRFEHFWGWQYRFEAYTAPAKKKLGYYAMPLLWRDDVVGWLNISGRHGNLKFDPGFVGGKPAETSFRSAFEAEMERFQAFLAPQSSLPQKWKREKMNGAEPYGHPRRKALQSELLTG